jgi:hypothetical protein
MLAVAGASGGTRTDSSTKKNRPAYRIYAINKKAGRKPQWTTIGAAWPHKDGQGFALDYYAKPLEGAEIVLRAVSDEDGPRTGELPLNRTSARVGQNRRGFPP